MDGTNREYMAGDLEARFGNIPLRRFNVSMLEAFQQEHIAQGKGPGTVNRKMGMLNTCSTNAVPGDGWTTTPCGRCVGCAIRPGVGRPSPAGPLASLLPIGGSTPSMSTRLE